MTNDIESCAYIGQLARLLHVFPLGKFATSIFLFKTLGTVSVVLSILFGVNLRVLAFPLRVKIVVV